MPIVNTKGIATGFELADEGLYRTTFTRFKNGVSKAGEAKATGIFTIKEPDAKKGKTIPVGWSFKTEALWKWKGDMIKLGIPAEALEDPKTDTDKVMQAVVGRDCIIRVTHRDYEGRTFSDGELVEEDSWNNQPVG